MTMGRARRLGNKLRPSLVGDGTIGLERKTGGLLRSDIDANVRGIRVSPSRPGMQAMLRGAVVGGGDVGSGVTPGAFSSAFSSAYDGGA